jgi:hypothetical protein
VRFGALAERALLGQALPNRYCFLVIKDGKLIHETYYGGPSQFPSQPNTRYTRCAWGSDALSFQKQRYRCYERIW